MNDSPINSYLRELQEQVRKATCHGGFLLSTGDVSKYWINGSKLRSSDVWDNVIMILRHMLQNFQKHSDLKSVCIPHVTGTSEDDFPWDPILSEVSKDSAFEINPLEFCAVSFDRHHKIVEFPEDTQPGNWVSLFTLSVHVEMIADVVTELRQRRRIVDNVIVLIEREATTRHRLEQLSVNLIPLIVCDNDTGLPFTVLEKHEEPYKSYHKYFI